ncbi:MAG: beta-N-acetylhexosaminidase [Clostridia bacterium]|nr:beta-N-acetylhexosaminidase [Clostridia bacterium]
MLRIIPTPKMIEECEGAFSLCSIAVFTDLTADSRVIGALSVFCKEAEAITGEYVPISVGEPFGRAIIISHGDVGEGYRITVTKDRIDILGDGAAGAFYAIQTLRQLIKEHGAFVPCCNISDYPTLEYRGFYHDVTRGRVPTLKKLKEIADRLSYLKINSLQLYVEDAFTFKELEGIVTADSALTPSEILELDSYCRDRFIDLVPSMSTFGHLFTLLQSEKYNHICELKGHKLTRDYLLERQWHHTLNVYHPDAFGVIKSMIEQYLPLFSSEYFNICCDETMDLCNGENAGRDKGDAYFYHVEKLVSLVKSYGKKVMLWGDECMARPDMAKERLPEDVTVLNWCYRKNVNEWIPKMFWERGFTQIVCTGTSCWDNFLENVFISVGNIESFAVWAEKYSCKGLLNTNWGDFGHVCPFNCNLYGMLFGAEKAWNPSSVTDGEFELYASRLLYGVDFNMAETLRCLARAMFTCDWSGFVIWHSAVTLEGKDMPLGYGGHPEHPFTAEKAVESIEICKAEMAKLLSLGRDDSVIADLILSIRAVELMNRVKLYLNGEDGYTDVQALQAELDSWLSEYSEAWLRDDKPSGLWRIREFIKGITETKPLTNTADEE